MYIFLYISRLSEHTFILTFEVQLIIFFKNSIIWYSINFHEQKIFFRIRLVKIIFKKFLKLDPQNNNLKLKKKVDFIHKCMNFLFYLLKLTY